ncbi:hypothetical protein MP228_007379 [Amoeboaphelidium protococcarum]|nr:hypothetical protein MP228_007379 [Amoeboaphelidium protococcarum]
MMFEHIDFVDFINTANSGLHQLNELGSQYAIPWYIEDVLVGYMKPDFVKLVMSQCEDTYMMGDQNKRLLLNPRYSTFHQRSVALQDAMLMLYHSQLIQVKLRYELYPVCGEVGSEEAVCVVERAFSKLLGIRQYGNHLNGYVIDANTGEMNMYVCKRSHTKSQYPGMLDNLVGGGRSYLMRDFNNIVKEAWEEVSMPPEVARQCKQVGSVSFVKDHSEGGIIRETEVIFDIDLSVGSQNSDDFKPVPNDGEVSEIYLQSIQDVVNNLSEFTPEAGLIVIDFLIRHKFIDQHPQYAKINELLRQNI